MTISFDYQGCYLEHKEFFDAMAIAMQGAGHRVGIIAGIREKEYDYQNILRDNKKEMLAALGFEPDFVHVWGENETIANGNLWKVSKINTEGVLVHFDDDGTELKRYTDRWILKTMNSGEQGKF